ncbi:MAG TPA: YhjD/YihY/BrkB family envelope integrity protein [Geobacteraceae bacterium]
MTPEKARNNGIRGFFATTLWELDPENYHGAKRSAVKYLQVAALVIRDFRADQCPLRASALSFTTILSIVPFFALAFAVLKGLGVQNKVEPFILNQVAAGSAEVVDRIVTYINNTKMASLGSAGLLALIVTAITLLGNVEEAFNIIWGVKETRPLARKFSDYVSVLVSAPLLMLAAMSVATTLQSKTVVQWVRMNTYLGDMLLYGIRFVQHLSVWAALVFLYIFIPNTRVRFKSALIGGILAGTLWQAAQWGYIHFQVGVARYNAIYGTVAVLPIFMVWIYTSWLIVLFGVELVCAHQNIGTFRRELRISVSYGLKELFALAVLQSIAGAFHFGRPPLTVEDLAERLDIPARIVRELVETLAGGGYLMATAGEAPAYQPARDIDAITVKDVLDFLKNFGGEYKIGKTTRGEELLRGVLAKADAGTAAALSGMTLKDLIGGTADT